MFKAFLKDCFRLRLLEFQNVAAKKESRIDEYLIELEKLDEYEKTNSLSENLPPLEQLVKWLEKRIIEHPFRTLKRTFGHTYFLLHEKEKVQAKFNMMWFACNLKRVFNMMSFNKLFAAIQ